LAIRCLGLASAAALQADLWPPGSETILVAVGGWWRSHQTRVRPDAASLPGDQVEINHAQPSTTTSVAALRHRHQRFWDSVSTRKPARTHDAITTFGRFVALMAGAVAAPENSGRNLLNFVVGFSPSRIHSLHFPRVTPSGLGDIPELRSDWTFCFAGWESRLVHDLPCCSAYRPTGMPTPTNHSRTLLVLATRARASLLSSGVGGGGWEMTCEQRISEKVSGIGCAWGSRGRGVCAGGPRVRAQRALDSSKGGRGRRSALVDARAGLVGVRGWG